MPVSDPNSQVIYDALKACGVRPISALPETWLGHLVALADEDPAMTLVRLAKEEEGVGISAGAHLATESVLMALRIPYERLDAPRRWPPAFARRRRWPRSPCARWRYCWTAT